MAEIHTGATITPSKVELLTSWMGHQRWYAAKGATPQLRRLRSFRFEDPAGEVGVEVMVLADDAGPSPVVYQVPVSYRGAPLAGAETALIGTFEHSVLGTRWVYDGCHDPVFADRLVAVLRGHDQVHSSTVDGALDDTVTGHAPPPWPAEPLVRSARVLSGEQSNTSIIIDASDGDGHAMPLMVKVFRTLQPGHNPDVDLQSALYEAGCHRVPSTMGHLRAHWPTAAGEPATEGEHAAYDLAFAQEFLPGVEDAWRVASRAVEEGHDFSEAARALGAATAEVLIKRVLEAFLHHIRAVGVVQYHVRTVFGQGFGDVVASASIARHYLMAPPLVCYFVGRYVVGVVRFVGIRKISQKTKVFRIHDGIRK